MPRHPHGPGCYACADPDGAARQLAAERAEIEAAQARARRHRQWGEWIRTKFYLFAGATDQHEFELVQALMLHHLTAANAIASAAGFDRAHLDRVEAAHPELSR